MAKTITAAATGAALSLMLSTGGALAGPTLDAIKAKGFIQCGVSTGLPGFSNPDSQGNWKGLDVDTCRAVAAAVFGDANKVKYTPLSAQQRFPALQSGEVDILSRNTTLTLTRDTSLGFNFPPTTYYDGQGFMVNRNLGVRNAKELAGATVCTQTGTTTEMNMADWFRSRNMDFKPVAMEAFEEARSAFFAGRCDVFTTDVSGLAGIRSSAPNPDDYVILPELVSKEPLGPAVRHGDDQWFDIVRWVVYAQFEGDERGITSENIDTFMDSKDPTIQRLLGTNPGMGAALGVDERWAYNVIKQVGNYAESFERNVGSRSPLKLERGPNQPWKTGGLMYAPPFR